MDRRDFLSSVAAALAQPEGVGSRRSPSLMVAPERRLARQWRRCGPLSVFAPVSQVQLRWQNLPPGDPLAAMNAEELLTLLQASLTEPQWRKLASDEGLGREDLNQEQQGLFLALLAPHFTGGRLSLQRQLGVELIAQGGGNQPLGLRSSGPAGDWSLERPLVGIWSQRSGVTLSEEVPNRLKPSQLVLSQVALSVEVPLAGAGTVGELVRRVADKSKLTLWCDPRFASLRVDVQGSAVPAGELLKALCWSVCGTFRRVGSGFVFTDDLVPFAVRKLALQTWLSQLKKKGQERLEQARVGLFEKQERYLSFASEDSLTPSTTLRERLRQRDVLIPIEELPAEAFERVRSWFQSLDQEAHYRRDVVQYAPKGQLWLRMPGKGKADAGEWALLDKRPSVKMPAQEIPSLARVPGQHVLLLEALEPSVLESRAALAKKQGFTHLWVEVLPGDVAAAEAAVAVGKHVGLPVHLRVRPLEAPLGSMAPRERNILGETPARSQRDWLRADDAQNQDEAIARCKALAGVAGIAGMVLEELVPPPHDPTLIYRFYGSGQRWEEVWGYSVALREAALQQGGPDPVDYFPTMNFSLSLPWFPDDDTLALDKTWRSVCEAALTPFRKRLWQELKASLGEKPLLRFAREYYGSFEKEPPEHPYIESWIRHARQHSKTALLALNALEGRLEDVVNQGWDGFVYAPPRERGVW